MQQEQSSKELIRSFRNAMLERYDQSMETPLYRNEQALFYCVRNGDEKALTQILNSIPPDSPTFGHMSDDPLKQAQFMIVSGITLATRYALAGGMQETQAYSLSDTYLRRIGNTLSEEEAFRIFIGALYDFTRRVHEARKQSAYGYTVTRCIAYITDHLYKKLTLTLLAEKCGVTPEYLSSSFHKETGLTLMRYIRREKLRLAAQMLEFSDFSLNRIATVLEFPSQSAFSEQFKEEYGVTPKVYRLNFCR